MIYYVSTTGNDSNIGNQTAPWKTLNKAFSTAVSGDTIHINAGTYTQATTLNLPVGVNLEGDGKALTIVKSSITGDWSVLLNIESSNVTNGNQTISGITFDGQYVSETNYKTWIGIWNTFRSNVIVDNCTIKNFYDRGVIFNGNGDNRSTIPVDPKVYTTGNKITNCIFDNTSRNSANYIAGQINVGGQKDMVIFNNVMTQTTRPAGKNGELIKYWGSGYNPGLKILKNTLKKANFTSNQYNGSGDWNFAIELFNNTGLEIAENTIQGSIDLNYNRVVSPYTYSVWIHNNVSDHNPFNSKEEQGIIFEFETTKAIVENNKFYNQAMGITFNVRTPNNSGGYSNPKPVGGYSATTDVIIRNNLFANLYSAYSYGNCCSAAGIQFLTEGGTNDAYVRNLQIYNNTFVTKTGNAAISGIDLTNFTANAASSDGITIRNNIFQGFFGQYLEGGSAKMLNTISKDNCLWQNGNNNNASWSGTLQTSGNLIVNPLLNSDYSIPITSPIYGKGIGYAPQGQVNTAPVVSLPGNQTITLPTSSLTITGNVTDDAGIANVSIVWSQITGPNTANLSSTTSPSITISNLIEGNYIFRLTATDSQGLSSYAEITITVNPVPNQMPIVSAGPDVTITLPTNSITLTATANDPDGQIVSYMWQNPTGNVISITPQVLLQNLTEGEATYTVIVKDNKGAMASDSVKVTVLPSPVSNSTSVIAYEFVDNQAAINAGLKSGQLYHTNGTLKIVI